MKNKTILNFMFFLMGFGVLTSSCEDMLTPDLDRYSEKFAQDTLYSFLGIMRSVQDVAERQVILGEARGDLASTTDFTSDSINNIANYLDIEDGDCSLLNIADYYKIINQCNYYLASADTAITQNGIYYMRREYAQVQAIRAWTYMQMVQFYGRVPFIATPISNTQAGENVEQKFQEDLKNAISEAETKSVATPSNLVRLLQEHGLDRALQFELIYGLPSYGNFKTGSGVEIASRKLMFPLYLVYGDLYLLANNYPKAAEMYYNYLRDKQPYVEQSSCFYNIFSNSGVEYYRPTEFSWTDGIYAYANPERITLVAGAGNKTFGRMLTAVSNVYGFKTTSRSITTGGEETGEKDENGKDETTDVVTSGSITVEADEKYLQLAPSDGYVNLSYGQKYCLFDLMSRDNQTGEAVISYPEKLGDARIYQSCVFTPFGADNVRKRVITKFARPSMTSYNHTLDQNTAFSFSNLYAYTMYRATQVWLRYAEAINRMGFPQHAFAVLKDGLSNYSVPSIDIDYTINRDTLRDLEADTIISITVDTVSAIPYSKYVENEWNTCGAYYISLKELQDAEQYNFLDFKRAEFSSSSTGGTGSMPQSNYSTNNHYITKNTRYMGIHALGSGSSEGVRDTLYTYDRCVAGKIATNKGLSGVAKDQFVGELLAYADTFPGTPDYYAKTKSTITYHAVDNALADGFITMEEVQDAVEDLIVDEMALEFAFEGFRFGDLVRVSGHRSNGVEWFANKIANRNGTLDAALKAKLMTRDNWFLPLPR